MNFIERFFLYDWKGSRQAHSRIIQIVDVKHNMQKVFDNLQSWITHYEREFGEPPIDVRKLEGAKR